MARRCIIDAAEGSGSSTLRAPCGSTTYVWRGRLKAAVPLAGPLFVADIDPGVDAAMGLVTF